MLKVGDLKKLLEGVDDDMPLAVELTNAPEGWGLADIVKEKYTIRVTGVWHKGITGEENAFVLAGFCPRKLQSVKTSQKTQRV